MNMSSKESSSPNNASSVEGETASASGDDVIVAASKSSREWKNGMGIGSEGNGSSGRIRSADPLNRRCGTGPSGFGGESEAR